MSCPNESARGGGCGGLNTSCPKGCTELDAIRRHELRWVPSFGWSAGERWELHCGRDALGRVLHFQSGVIEAELWVNDGDAWAVRGFASLREAACALLAELERRQAGA